MGKNVTGSRPTTGTKATNSVHRIIIPVFLGLSAQRECVIANSLSYGFKIFMERKAVVYKPFIKDHFHENPEAFRICSSAGGIGRLRFGNKEPDKQKEKVIVVPEKTSTDY